MGGRRLREVSVEGGKTEGKKSLNDMKEIE